MKETKGTQRLWWVPFFKKKSANTVTTPGEDAKKEESAVGGEQGHNVQGASRPRKLHGNGKGRHPVCRQGDMSFNGESDNWQLAAAQKVSKMFQEEASGSGDHA